MNYSMQSTLNNVSCSMGTICVSCFNNTCTIRGKKGLLFMKRYKKGSEKTSQGVGTDTIIYIQ